MAKICRKAGISQATYFNWKKYDGLLPTEIRRLKQPEQENGKLKKLVADLSLDMEMLQDVIRRKLSSLAGSASWSRRSVASGRSRSARPAKPSSSIGRPTTTNPVAPARLPSNRRSRRSAMFVFATVIVVFTSCCVVKAGAMARTRRGASIANWACNYATKRRSAGSRPSCAMIAGRRRDRTRPGRWTSSMTSWRPDTSCACSRLSIPSPASRRRWRHGLPSAAPMSWRYGKGPARKWDSRQRSASIKAASACPAILTSGPTSADVTLDFSRAR